LEGSEGFFFSWEAGPCFLVRSILQASFLPDSNARLGDRFCWYPLLLLCFEQRSLRFVPIFQPEPDHRLLAIAFFFERDFELYCARFENEAVHSPVWGLNWAFASSSKNLQLLEGQAGFARPLLELVNK
jgi:hypothetical protein